MLAKPKIEIFLSTGPLEDSMFTQYCVIQGGTMVHELKIILIITSFISPLVFQPCSTFQAKQIKWCGFAKKTKCIFMELRVEWNMRISVHFDLFLAFSGMVIDA